MSWYGAIASIFRSDQSMFLKKQELAQIGAWDTIAAIEAIEDEQEMEQLGIPVPPLHGHGDRECWCNDDH